MQWAERAGVLVFVSARRGFIREGSWTYACGFYGSSGHCRHIMQRKRRLTIRT